MNLLSSSFLRAAAAVALLAFQASAAEPEAALSARELANRLSAASQNGTSYVRLRMEVKQPPETTKLSLQIQIKERRTKSGTDVVYQVLFPRERKGEGVLVRGGGGRAPSGALFTPPDKLRTLTAAQMSEPLFESDLSYQDLFENFFAWEHQALVGNEAVNRVNCTILESKPGKGDRSPYASVRSWIDTRRMLAMRVEKYSAPGRLARRIDTTRVSNDQHGHSIPANLTVRDARGDSVTELDGSKIKNDVTFTDREFTPEGLKELTAAKSAD